MTISGVPRIPTWALPRPRLSARFDDEHTVVLAHAPAGYGKTVAMAQWAAEAEASGVWLRIRERQLGAGAFVELLSRELELLGLLASENPLRMAADALAGGADAWQLARAGLRGLTGPFVLAIDSFDHLHRDTQLALLDLAHELSSLNIRATARQQSILNEPALLLTLELARIDASELALTTAEAAEILGVDPASDAVAEVLAQGGVPLFAKLMETAHAGEGEHGAEPSRNRPLGSTLSALVDSFIRLQLASVPVDDSFMSFLTAVSPAEMMDADLAAELMSVARGGVRAIGEAPSADEVAYAKAMLDRAEAEGLGLWNISPGRASSFSFTPLIQESFERRLRASGPGRVRELTITVAHWELAVGFPFAALRRAVQLEDWAFASRVIRLHWNELLRNHGEQLRQLFRGTPLAVLRSHPFVAMLLALDANRQGRSRLRALEYFALARFAARKYRVNSSPADRAVLRAIETASLRVSGQFTAALAPALDGYETVLAMSPADRDELGRTEPTVLNQFGTTFFYSDLEEEALAAFARSTAVGEAKGLTAGLQGIALSAGTLAIGGDMPEARGLVGEAAGLTWPEGWLTGYMGSFLQLAEATLALEAFDTDTAEQHLRSLDAHRETIEHWPLLAHVDALIDLLRGEIDRARFRLHAEVKMQQRRRAVSPQTMSRLARTRALIELAAGNPFAAEKALGTRHTARTLIGLARVALVRGKPEHAVRLLLQAGQSDGFERLSSRSEAELLTLRAGALSLMDDQKRADVAVRTALEFLQQREQGLALAMMPAHALDAVFVVADRAGLAGAESRRPGARPPAMIPASRPKSVFTPRELALIEALPRTANNAELARSLSISPNTVKTQLRGLYRKLGVGTRADAFSAIAAMGFSNDPAEVAESSLEPFE